MKIVQLRDAVGNHFASRSEEGSCCSRMFHTCPPARRFTSARGLQAQPAF
jgi:hypothetical protein